MLTADCNINRYVDQELRTLSVKAATTIYRGSLVGLDRSCGYARPLVGGCDQFQGLAYERCENAGVDGEREVILFTQGDFEFDLPGATKINIGQRVYATDDNTLTFSDCVASYVGKIVDVPVVGKIILRIDPLN